MRSIFPGQIAIFFLASAVAIPALAQSGAPRETPGDSSSQEMQTATPQNAPPSAAQQQSLSVTGSQLQPPKEGFWGRMNPFARKKWVKKQTDPINDRLSELDEVNAKNANDIQDVDSRAQAGIRRAQCSRRRSQPGRNRCRQQAQKARRHRPWRLQPCRSVEHHRQRPRPVSPGH